MNNKPNIAVLGAGVVGLSVAQILQEQHPNSNITIIADKFYKETTSYVAAGIFRPGTSFRGSTQEITKKWLNDSWEYWNEILKTPESVNIGVKSLSAYIFSKQNEHVTRNHLIEDLVPIYRSINGSEYKLGPPGTKYGSYFATLLIDCDRYLPYMTDLIIKGGGKIVNAKVESFASISNFGKFDVVFNCTGLGAKFLCNDCDLVPIRGQVIKVKAPWVKTALYGDYDTYIIPGFDGTVTLGGVRNYDSYNTEYCKFDEASILERCYELMPSLRNAEIVGNRVGLRPHRTPVRVEPEIINGLRVVHCYGHGGYGVMCAPGTAKHAVQIGIDLLRSNVKNKL